ncbi:uncharacterized protein TRIADDRAFT_1068, partial [Trichoplax adhaerens]
GWFSFRPDYLQFFNSPPWLLALLCFYAVVVNLELLGFRGVAVLQIEKRFNMTSTLAGSIMSTVDISNGLCGVMLSYYVGQRHKSKWIGYGIICLSIGSVIFILPHFIAGPYYYSELVVNATRTTSTMCNVDPSNASSAACASATSQSTPWTYPMIFVLGLVLCGIGYSIQYSVGLAYIDENVSPIISPVYVSIFHMVAVLGPTLGFVIGGAFSNIYVDWPATANGRLNLQPNDPRWIGAWWLGYLIVGLIAFVSSLFIFAYPYHLPTYQKSKAKRLAMTKSVKRVDNKYGKRWADFPRAFYEVISNRIFLLAVMGLSLDQIPTIGLVTFLPKYIQSQSGASLLLSTILTAVTAVISAAVGQVASGIILKRWKIVGSKISRFCFYACVANVISSCIFLISCHNPNIAGVYVPYPSPSNNTSIIRSQAVSSIQPLATCNAKCYCDSSLFSPVCGANGMTYQSPCHAGCSSMVTISNAPTGNYSKCSCINPEAENIARRGICTGESCGLMYPLLIGIMVMVVSTSISFSPTIAVILRSIPESQTTFAMGVEGLIYRILGGLLGPVVYGYVMDASCILWNERCNVRQFCWRYDNARLGLYMFTATIICKAIKLVIYGFLWYFH